MTKKIKTLREAFSPDKEPPVIIILKRKTVRLFPDGVKVALYTNSKMGVKFALPFDASGNAQQQMNFAFQEETGSILEGVDPTKLVTPWGAVQRVVLNKQNDMLHWPDGERLRLDLFSAQCMMNVFEALNTENKTKMIDSVNKSKKRFLKIMDFCYKQHH